MKTSEKLIEDIHFINDFLAYISTSFSQYLIYPIQRMPLFPDRDPAIITLSINLYNISKEVLLTDKLLSKNLCYFSGCQTWNNLTVIFTNLITLLIIRNRVIMILLPLKIFMDLECKYFILENMLLF